MKRTIAIDPVTRIEGHAKVFLDLDEHGELAAAGLVVNELRGFERILVGTQADRLPLITARICGVCPTAHHLAAARALDMLAGVEPPPAAHLLRELMYMGHLAHSHALSLFVLQGPDLLLGMDADPAERNVVGLVKAAPELARQALECRTLGQKINETIGGRGTHPVTAVAGGITFELTAEKKKALKKYTADLLALVLQLAPAVKEVFLRRVEADARLIEEWTQPVWSLGAVHDDGARLALYGGRLRAVDAEGAVRLDFPAADYAGYTVEAALDWSYMKPVRLACDGERHVYRVGPLARLNVAGSLGTERADAELAALRARFGRPAHATLLQTYARLIELIHVAERAYALARDPALSGPARVAARLRAGRGVGHIEAPRGSLIHDYEVDDAGIVRAANLIVATQQNYEAINGSIFQAARTHVLGNDEPLLNAVEFAIHCYDPCLSCATHALGRMPLEVTLRRGGVAERVARRRA